jgi:hypothetical protein
VLFDVGQHKTKIMIRNISIVLVALIAFLQGAFADEPKGHVFDAKLIRVQMRDAPLKKLVVLGGDHRYVVTLELQQDLGKLGKKGETLNFTIDNPARDLQLNNYKASYGKSLKFRLSKVLRREVPEKAQQVAPPNEP